MDKYIGPLLIGKQDTLTDSWGWVEDRKLRFDVRGPRSISYCKAQLINWRESERAYESDSFKTTLNLSLTNDWQFLTSSPRDLSRRHIER